MHLSHLKQSLYNLILCIAKFEHFFGNCIILFPPCLCVLAGVVEPNLTSPLALDHMTTRLRDAVVQAAGVSMSV